MKKSSPHRPDDPLKFQPTIHVTQYVIDKSRRNSRIWCMLALALASTLRGATRIEVTAEIVRFNYLGHRYYFATPAKAARYIIAYDGGAKIKPWSVRLITMIAPPNRVENRGPYGPRKNKTCAKPAPRKYPAVNKQGGAYADGKASPGKIMRNTSERCRRWHGIKVPKGLLVA